MKTTIYLAILMCMITTATAADQVVLTMDHTQSPFDGVTLSPDYTNRKHVWPNSKSPTIEVELKRGDTFTIQIKGANKLLYSYVFSEVKSEPTDNAKAVDELIKALTKFDIKLTPKSQSSESESIDVMSELQKKLKCLSVMVASIETLTMDSNNNMKEVQGKVKDWDLVALKKWFAELTEELGKSNSEPIPDELNTKSELAQIGENNKEIDSLGSKKSLTAEEKAKLEDLNKINEREREVIREKNEKLNAFFFEAYPTTQALNLLNSKRSEIDNAFKLLETFQKQVATAAELDPSKPIAYNAKEKQVMTLTITNPIKQEDPHWTGTLTIIVIPRERFNFKINPTVVYSFINTDAYEAKPFAQDDVIKYKVTHTESDYNKFALGALWQVNPKAWDGDDLSASIDMGFAYDDKLGAVLGGSVSFLRRASIGMGIIAQQVEVLGVNLAVDQVLDKDTDLKLDKEFKTGFYLGLKVDLGK